MNAEKPDISPTQHRIVEPSTKVKTVQNVALADATAKQKPSLWTRRMFQLYGILFIATLNAAVNGYDGSVMSSINSYAQYRSYFGFSLTEGTPATGIVYAIFTIGSKLNQGSGFDEGADVNSEQWKGRRWGMFLGAGVIIIGAIVQATSQNLAAFMTGRFMLVSTILRLSLAGSILKADSTLRHKLYQWIAGLENPFVVADDVLWNSVYFGVVPAGANDRHEEALDIMARYHGEDDRHSPIVQLELREMMEEISKTGADKRWWDFRELFDSREVRYRTMLTCAIALFGQWTGNGPVSYYYPQMLAGAGIENNHTQLLLQGMQSVLSFAGALIGAAYTDHWGRRPQLLLSTFIISLLFLIILILNALNTTTSPATHLTVAKSSAASNAEIAMIFLFSFVFAIGWTPMQGLYAVEVLRYESRAKGMALYTLVGNVAGFYNTFVTGIAFSGAGWRYYYLFIFWDLLEAAFIYVSSKTPSLFQIYTSTNKLQFFFVETKGRTLEELTEIFNAAKPVKYSLTKSEVLIYRNEGVTEVLEKESLG
ncbi:hypothetical protein NHQ30_004054 [Ciborinia camelliae]|nr:hypothetical protein NHQ30_004054 [Ciborinia camelliae]